MTNEHYAYWADIQAKALSYASAQGWYYGWASDPKEIDNEALLYKANGNRYVSALRQILFVALREGPQLTYREIAEAYKTSISRVYVSVSQFQAWEAKGLYKNQVSFKKMLVKQWHNRKRNVYERKYRQYSG